MSASLVGSEMCIRDSIPPCRTAGGALTMCHACKIDTHKPWSARPKASTCLLYTSDAADDM
eukprot:11763203-Alexandrium_andersonii.AAC.1